MPTATTTTSPMMRAIVSCRRPLPRPLLTVDAEGDSLADREDVVGGDAEEGAAVPTMDVQEGQALPTPLPD